jgi:hypothetical protein
MPLDDTGFNPAAYVVTPVKTPAYLSRWGAPNSTRLLRAITPRSDAQALLHIWQMMETKWSRKYNDGDKHCIVGWVGYTCEPTTINDYKTPQVRRVLQRLHDALPKSGQRKGSPHWQTLAKYNDTRSLPTVRAWVQRAYLAELNAHIDALNNQPNA